MSDSIYWRLMFRVNDRCALDRSLARALLLIGDGVKIGECKPYWKNPELWECKMVSPVPVGAAAEQVFTCLVTAMSLATGWYILGSLSAVGAEGFSGVFNAKLQGTASGQAVGLEWASFEIGTSGNAKS